VSQLVPLKFRPGINREVTRFSSEGGWYDCDKIRFRMGFPEVIGGWSKFRSETFLGTCRSIYPWVLLSGAVHIGFGTNLKYYIDDGSGFYDVTPIRNTTAAGEATFSATNGESEITVTDNSHGAVAGDFVTFSSAASLGGNITASVLNQEHQITQAVDVNTYTIDPGVTANASDTGNGGSGTVAEYQINVGLDTGILGVGFGADPYSDGGWGDAGTAPAGSATLRVWSHDNFGEDLVINPTDAGIFYWDATNAATTRAVALSDLSGAESAPTIAKRVMVSDTDRHIICFGCDDEFDIGTQDPLLIRWSDQENAAEWRTLTTTTAGSIRLSAGTEIITALQTKREILIFTDVSMHSMQFLGPPYTFGIQTISFDVQIVGPQAAVNVGDRVFWMANGKFMRYDGRVQEMPCSVEEYVFRDFSVEERQKVAAGHNLRYSEVWWFYPSKDSSENDRYVIYNYEQDIWYFGAMARTAWSTANVLSYPLAASTDGYIYQHDFGFNDGSENPPVPINAHIESSHLDIGNGDSFFFAHRAIPDITFLESTGTEPKVTMTFKAKEFPGGSYLQTDAESATQTSSSPVELYTNQLDIRLRGRSMAVRVESNDLNTAWRLGTPRVEIRTDGRK